MNRFATLLLTSVIGIAVGCEKESTSSSTATDAKSSAPAADSTAKKDDHDHDHDHGSEGDAHEGEKHDLGTQQAGGMSLKATQIGEIKAGGEGVFEIAVTGGAAKPTAVRAWVGTEAGDGSAKTKGSATESDFDVHIELPQTLPADSKLWVEVENSAGRSRASFELEKEGEHDHDHGKKGS